MEGRRKHVRRACTECALAHSACSDVRPCTRCVTRGLRCKDPKNKKRIRIVDESSHFAAKRRRMQPWETGADMNLVGSFHPSDMDPSNVLTAQPVRSPSPAHQHSGQHPGHQHQHPGQHQHPAQHQHAGQHQHSGREAHPAQHISPRLAQRAIPATVAEPAQALEVNLYYTNATPVTLQQQQQQQQQQRCNCPTCTCTSNGVCTDTCAGNCCDPGLGDTPRWEAQPSLGSSYVYASPSGSAFKPPNSVPRNWYDYNKNDYNKNIQHVACCCLPPLSPLVPSVVPISPSAPLLPTPNIQPTGTPKQELLLPSISGLMEALSRSPPQDNTDDNIFSHPPPLYSPPPHLPPGNDRPEFKPYPSPSYSPSRHTTNQAGEILTMEPRLFSFKPKPSGSGLFKL